MKYGLVATLFLVLIAGYGLGQPINLPAPIMVRYISDPVSIDGELSESFWLEEDGGKNFWQKFPADTARAIGQTEVYMVYDDKHLYIGAICRSTGDNYVIPSLRRDFRAGGNDNITFVFDPFRDRTNAFVFGINPYGVVREALISNGGNNPRSDWNDSWDNKWRGESSIADGYWSCELAIPFSTLRFKEGETEWNFNCYRFDTQLNEWSTLNRIPLNQMVMSLAYMSTMVWDRPLRKSGSTISLIPYTTGSYYQTFLEEVDDRMVRVNESPDFDFATGGDAKIAVTPGLNLDLTVNPDFSQVEVDEQQLNLSRFELFFPERRQFFLENADLFSTFGDGRINPFFSRRIGIGRDTATASAAH